MGEAQFDQGFELLVGNLPRVQHRHRQFAGEVGGGLVHGGRAQHDHIRAVLFDCAQGLGLQFGEDDFLLAFEQFGDIGPRVDRADRSAAMFPAVLAEHLLVEREPLRPHGDHAEALAQHHSGSKARLARADHGDIERRAQRPQTAIADRIDQHAGVTLVLGGDAGLEHRPVHQQRIVIGIAQRRAPAHRFERRGKTGAHEPFGQLLRAIGDAGFIHCNRYDDLDAVHGEHPRCHMADCHCANDYCIQNAPVKCFAQM